MCTHVLIDDPSISIIHVLTLLCFIFAEHSTVETLQKELRINNLQINDIGNIKIRTHVGVYPKYSNRFLNLNEVRSNILENSVYLFLRGKKIILFFCKTGLSGSLIIPRNLTLFAELAFQGMRANVVTRVKE